MSKMRAASAIPVAFATMLGGCGLWVPEIQENRLSPVEGQLMVQSIVQSVHCEAANALRRLREKDLEFAKKYHQQPVTDFLLGWGVQLTLTLTIDEKSGLNPNAVWLPPSPLSTVLTLTGAGTVSADATRTDKMSFYYKVTDLMKRAPCATGVQQGNEPSLLVQSDLKLEEWLADYLMLLGTREGQVPTSKAGFLKSNVLSHDVKFEVLSSGSLTPAWKLKRVTFNQSGSLFSTSRDRTHDLIFTLGPGDDTGFTNPAPYLADNSIQIGNAVSTSLRPFLSP
jgi:hypothetical protein